jgi:hypothetical protein
MSTNTPADALAIQLIERLGLPKKVTKLTLTFEARQPIVAEVAFIPESEPAITLTSRFKCTPIDEVAAAAPTSAAPVAFDTAQGV